MQRVQENGYILKNISLPITCKLISNYIIQYVKTL